MFLFLNVDCPQRPQGQACKRAAVTTRFQSPSLWNRGPRLCIHPGQCLCLTPTPSPEAALRRHQDMLTGPETAGGHCSRSVLFPDCQRHLFSSCLQSLEALGLARPQLCLLRTARSSKCLLNSFGLRSLSGSLNPCLSLPFQNTFF